MNEKTKLNMNLLPSRAKFQASRMKAVALSLRISTLVIIVWVSAVVLVLGTFFGTGWWLQGEKGKYDKALNAYLSMSESVVNSQLIKYRAKILGRVLADRFEYSEAFNKVNSLFGEEVLVRNFELKEQSMFKMTVVVDRGDLVDLVEERVEEINNGGELGIKKVNILGATYSSVSRLWLIEMEVFLK